MKPVQVIILSLFAVLVSATIWPINLLSRKIEPLPTIAALKDFSLTDSNNSEFSSSKLAGKVWLANFFFTSCGGICPFMTGELRKIFQRFGEREDLHFVSITVDPLRDSPSALKEYANNFDIDVPRWHFLTGQAERINDISLKGFMIGNIDDPSFHSDRIVLIDREQKIRGYYSSADEEALKKLVRDIEAVL